MEGFQLQVQGFWELLGVSEQGNVFIKAVAEQCIFKFGEVSVEAKACRTQYNKSGGLGETLCLSVKTGTDVR